MVMALLHLSVKKSANANPKSVKNCPKLRKNKRRKKQFPSSNRPPFTDGYCKYVFDTFPKFGPNCVREFTSAGSIVRALLFSWLRGEAGMGVWKGAAAAKMQRTRTKNF